MTPEQMKDLRAGDIITCTHGNWHFETGSDYVVKHDDHSHDEVVECDQGVLHFVHTLNPKRWELKHKAISVGMPHDLTWQLAEAIDAALIQFTKDHPEVKVNTKMHGKKILLTIKEVTDGSNSR